jgi:hypothetical protein
MAPKSRRMHHIRTEERDGEGFFRTLRERTRELYYDNNIPSTRMENLRSFMDVFMLWYYNHHRRHQGMGRVTVSEGR